jgi:hypothetical protein
MLYPLRNAEHCYLSLSVLIWLWAGLVVGRPARGFGWQRPRLSYGWAGRGLLCPWFVFAVDWAGLATRFVRQGLGWTRAGLSTVLFSPRAVLNTGSAGH